MVTNSNEGKTVKVTGHIFCDDKPVIEVVLAFLYRGCFSDYDNTFEATEEVDYIVESETNASVGVLQSKEWFDWTDESKPLAPR